MTPKRSIFEEVGQGAARPAAQGGMIDARPGGARHAIRAWLGILFALTVAIVAVGGITRLTDSGLSITEWRPVTGALPPLGDAAWEAEFALYRETPQFRLANPNMTLDQFRTIFWWEWGHRQLGRLIGLVWALGFAWFLVRRQIPAGWTPRLLGLGALGGLQGLIGWWMVASGLTGEMVSVASYRLAVHLGLAFAILGLITWYMLLLGRSDIALIQARRIGERRLAGMATGVMHLAFLQILLGALVAGIDAGRAFPTWPLMGEGFFPPDAFYVPGAPAWRAFFENPGLVQFMHRMAGYLLLALGVFALVKGRQSGHAAVRRAFGWMAAVLLAQVALGIVTVLHAAPLPLALAHQLLAVAFWVLIVRARMLARYPPAVSVRDGMATR